MKKIRVKAIEKESQNLNYYLNLPYKLVIVPEEAGGFFAEIEELPGCMTQGETIEEILKNIGDAKRLWLQTALDDKMEIPLPECMREYSGKFLVRIPSLLHKRITALAKKEGVSINQMVLSLLSDKTTAKEMTAEIRAVLWENTQKMDEMYRMEKPLMVSEPKKPYSFPIPKKIWSGKESIKS